MNEAVCANLLPVLLQRRELSPDQMCDFMEDLIQGRCDEVEAAACLVALRMKGETAGEVAAAAGVLRRHMAGWDPGREVLDTCGTGGDCAGTFNISTATAFVVAGAGMPVVKHGNRSVSSQSGSADVLGCLGVDLEQATRLRRECLDAAGLAFCFAPHFHPALKKVAGIRKRLGIPTIFNCLGPLANPAGAPYQLLGVGRAELLDLMAQALLRLGTRRALVVHGADGLDEVSLSAPTHVRVVTAGQVASAVWTPANLGLAPCESGELLTADAAESAAIIRRVLAGEEGAPLRVVLANAAAALLTAGKVSTLPAGVEQARQAVASGKAAAVLERLIAICRG